MSSEKVHHSGFWLLGSTAGRVMRVGCRLTLTKTSTHFLRLPDIPHNGHTNPAITSFLCMKLMLEVSYT